MEEFISTNEIKADRILELTSNEALSKVSWLD